MAIVKYTLDTGKEVFLTAPEKFEEIEGESWSERYDRRKRQLSPVKYFEEKILNELSSNTIEEYAKDNFDLVEEDDVEEKLIGDFSNDEIQEEYFSNLKLSFSVTTEKYASRFFKIIQSGCPLEIEEFLNQQEKKHNIV